MNSKKDFNLWGRLLILGGTFFLLFGFGDYFSVSEFESHQLCGTSQAYPVCVHIETYYYANYAIFLVAIGLLISGTYLTFRFRRVRIT